MLPLIAFAVIWFLSGYLAALLIGRFIHLPFGPLQFGLLGMIIGLVALISRLQTERGWRLFYEGPAVDEDGDLLLGCLWLIPFQVLLFTLLGWLGWLLIN